MEARLLPRPILLDLVPNPPLHPTPSQSLTSPTPIKTAHGRWGPEIPRNIILRYSEPGNLVFDQMCGSALVERELTGMGDDAHERGISLTDDGIVRIEKQKD